MILLCLFIAGSLGAQTDILPTVPSGNIQGRIIDAEGNPLANIQVVVTQEPGRSNYYLFGWL